MSPTLSRTMLNSGHKAPVLYRSLLAWHSDYDNQSGNSSRRILFPAHALPRECGAYLAQHERGGLQFGERSFALSSLRSGRIEGLA